MVMPRPPVKLMAPRVVVACVNCTNGAEGDAAEMVAVPVGTPFGFQFSGALKSNIRAGSAPDHSASNEAMGAGDMQAIARKATPKPVAKRDERIMETIFPPVVRARK